MVSRKYEKKVVFKVRNSVSALKPFTGKQTAECAESRSKNKTNSGGIASLCRLKSIGGIQRKKYFKIIRH
jgi:hypothetical protein